MPFWHGSVVLNFFAALLLLYIMAGGSGGHQTTLNEKLGMTLRNRIQISRCWFFHGWSEQGLKMEVET
jgi:hypothetical protein